MAPTLVYLSFGRMNPVTVGHEKMVNYMIEKAGINGAKAIIGLSMTQNGHKNPLTPAEKLNLVTRAFKNKKLNGVYIEPHIIPLLAKLNKKYPGAQFKIFVGSNRQGRFVDPKYFPSVIGNVVVPRPTGSMSATQVRNAAFRGDRKFFSESIPASILGNTNNLMKLIKTRRQNAIDANKAKAEAKKRKANTAANTRKKKTKRTATSS